MLKLSKETIIRKNGWDDKLPILLSLKSWLVISRLNKLGISGIDKEQVNKLDSYTRQHSNRVWMHMVEDFKLLAEYLDLPCDYNIEQALMLGGQLHDLGKAYISRNILCTSSKLTEMELSIIKKHPRIGYLLIKNILFKWLEVDEEFDLRNYIGYKDVVLTKAQLRRIILNIVYYHHEKEDGTGYPVGLKGSEIPLEAAVAVLADVRSAIMDKRVYKEGMSMSFYMSELIKGLGTNFSYDLGKIILNHFFSIDPSFRETNQKISNFKWNLGINSFLFGEKNGSFIDWVVF